MQRGRQLKVNALTSKQCNNLWLSAKRTRIAIEETCELHNLTHPLHMLHPSLLPQPYTPLSIPTQPSLLYFLLLLLGTTNFSVPNSICPKLQNKRKQASREGEVEGIKRCREVQEGAEWCRVVQCSAVGCWK